MTSLQRYVLCIFLCVNLCIFSTLLLHLAEHLLTFLDVRKHTFLGGLSLHLNHLIQSRMEISYWLFKTLPIGLLLSNLDSRQLETSPMTSYDQF